MILLLTFNLIFLLSFNILGQEDRCIYSYGFENNKDVPSVDNLLGAKVSNDGWGIQSYDGKSSFASKKNALCTFTIELQGPFMYEFQWGLKINGSASGLFLFYEDGKTPISCTGEDEVGPNNVEGSGKHTLKWVASRSKDEEYIGLLDALSITTAGYCPEPMPPIQPAKPSGPIEGDTNKKYSFFAGSEDHGGDGIEYVFDWGDGNVSEPASGEPAMAEHNWTKSGLYGVKVKSILGGRQSDWSKSHNIKIFKLKEVSTGEDLRSIIKNIDNYTKILLLGDTYRGPLVLENKHNISIRSKIGTKILCDDCGHSIIGLENLNNFTLDGLNILDNSSDCAIYLNKSRDCIISNNHINLKNKKIGIQEVSGCNNSIKNNMIDTSNATKCTVQNICAALCFNNTDKINIECNKIRGDLHPYIYYFVKTNISVMKVDLSNHGLIYVDQCCVHLENGTNMAWRYLNGSSCRGIRYEVC